MVELDKKKTVLETMKETKEEEERGRRVPIPIPSIYSGLTLAQYSKS